MTKHIIDVLGCDDYTTVSMELTETELAVIKRLADMVERARHSQRQPSVVVDDSALSWDRVMGSCQEDVANNQEQQKENAS